VLVVVLLVVALVWPVKGLFNTDLYLVCAS